MGSRSPAGPFPDYVFIQTFGGCNAHCGFCPHGTEADTAPRGRMELELLEQLADELATFKPQRLGLFLNNEPMLDKRLPDIARMFREKLGPEPEMMLISNGSFMTGEMFRGLAAGGIDRIKVSFQSMDPKVYETIMKIPFQRTMDNLMRAVAIKKQEGWKKPVIDISTVVIDLNEAEIPAMKAFWKKHGVRATASPCTNYGGNIKEDASLHPFGLEGGVRNNYCPRIERELNIMLDGTVSLCCYDWSGEVVLGNVNEQSIGEIWQGAEATRIRESIRRGDYSCSKLCENCEVSRYPARHHRNLRGMMARVQATIDRLFTRRSPTEV